VAQLGVLGAVGDGVVRKEAAGVGIGGDALVQCVKRGTTTGGHQIGDVLSGLGIVAVGLEEPADCRNVVCCHGVTARMNCDLRV